MKREKRRLITLMVLLTLLINSRVAFAQDKHPPVQKAASAEIAVQPHLYATSESTFKFFESKYFGKVVQGAPYSATAVTEFVQTLGDGNKIVRKNEAKIYRDSEGRTRREQKLESIGKWTAAGDAPQMIYINDPVAGLSYNLDPRTRTVRKGAVAFKYQTDRVNEQRIKEHEKRVKESEKRAKEIEKRAEKRALEQEREAKQHDAILKERAIKRETQFKEREQRMKEAFRKREQRLQEQAKAREQRMRQHEAEIIKQARERETRMRDQAREREERLHEQSKQREKRLKEQFEEREERMKEAFKEREQRLKVRKVPSRPIGKAEPKIKQPTGVQEKVVTTDSVIKPIARTNRKVVEVNKKVEGLGKQMIEGVEAEGTRSTRTIEAGEIGNALPIEIIDESWYSAALQVQVMTRHSDPRSGVTTYRLTNLSRGEPDRSLFAVPPDYTIVNDSQFKRRITKPSPPAKPSVQGSPSEAEKKPESPKNAKPARDARSPH